MTRCSMRDVMLVVHDQRPPLRQRLRGDRSLLPPIAAGPR